MIEMTSTSRIKTLEQDLHFYSVMAEHSTTESKPHYGIMRDFYQTTIQNLPKWVLEHDRLSVRSGGL
jgi:hypothetical protein